jgi:glutamyl-tRNA reductase
MSVQLLSVSHKTAPLAIREKLSLNEEQQKQLLHVLTGRNTAEKKTPAGRKNEIEEAVVLATCNRTEVYIRTAPGSDDRRTFSVLTDALLSATHASDVQNIRDYIFMYQDDKAVHHLFAVTAGFDSMLLGEDQILGQVKQAYDLAKSENTVGTCFNTLFRYAVTAAKKIKTDTVLSKTSVSTATLALKAAEQSLGTLKGKKILIIGASGKIGGVVLKNATCIDGARLFVTRRTHNVEVEPTGHAGYKIIEYEDRYRHVDDADVLISATRAPHFTLTADHVREVCHQERKRVFVDLAVPMDIDPGICSLPGAVCYNLEDMKELARENNERRQDDMESAKQILRIYEDDFGRRQAFQDSLPAIRRAKEIFLADEQEHGTEKALSHFYTRMRDAGDPEQLRAFYKVLVRMNQEWSE